MFFGSPFDLLSSTSLVENIDNDPWKRKNAGLEVRFEVRIGDTMDFSVAKHIFGTVGANTLEIYNETG